MSVVSSAQPFFSTCGLTKRYGKATVLNDVSVEFHSGEVHALLGANGAGKSTLVRMIAGLVAPSNGTMMRGGQPYQPSFKRDAETAGVEIVQQELNLIPTLSVAENISLSRMPSFAGFVNHSRLHRRAESALERFGLTDIDPSTPVSELGVGRQQMVEIAAALDRDCKLLILDEPTAALSASESKMLFTQMKSMCDRGISIIYISHRLDEVRRLSQRVSVLRDGCHVGTYRTEECSTDRMVESMSGEEPPSKDTNARANSTTVAMKVVGITGGPVRDVSFQVHREEVLGIGGLVGSGRTELLRLIFGADVADSGYLTLGDSSVQQRFEHPAAAVNSGIAMLTEDRKQNGLMLSQSIVFNTTIAAMWTKFSLLGFRRGANEHQHSNQRCESLDVRCESMRQSVGTLSGGNQQKVAIAKWLVRDAEVFLFDEPTRGIDVAARRRIYRLVDELTAQGKAVVVVSSDSEELLEISDRIAVMSGGRLVKTFAREDATGERITQAAFASHRKENSL